MPTRAFAGNHRGSQQDSKQQDVAPPPTKAEVKVAAISYLPELDDLSAVSDAKVRREKRVPTEERPVRNFDAIVAEQEAARKATKERARGKTLPGERRRPSAGDTAFQEDDDELTVVSSVGVGRFTRALTETRDAVFHRDPPKIEIFTYRSHEQVAEVQEPVAWTNFEDTRGDHNAPWKAARDRFFKYGIIGASRDNPTIFFDEQAQKEDAHRKKLQGMSAKERRLSRLSTVPCVLPPVQPVFPQHDTSFLQPRCLAKATARYVPSIFNEHPLEEFVRFGGRPPTGSLFPPLVQSKAEGLGKENVDVVREEIKERKEENAVKVCAEIKESKSKKGIAGKEDWEGEECKESKEDGEGQEGQECEERNAGKEDQEDQEDEGGEEGFEDE